MTRSGRRYGRFCACASILIATLATSCGDYHRTAWSHFEDIDSGGWDPADIITFEPWPADSAEAASAVYDIDLVLRSTLRSGFSRIPVVITIEDNDKTISSDTVIIGAKEKNITDVRENYGVRKTTMTISRGVRLTDGYNLSISPLTDREDNKGLLNVGLILRRPD